MNKPMEIRVKQFQSFYQRNNENTLLGFFLGSEFPIHRYSCASSLPEGRLLTPDDFDPDKYAQVSYELFQAHEHCGGDFIWSGSPFWGIPWVEAALGCPVYANHATGSLYTEKPKNFNGQIPLFSEENPWIHKMGSFLESLNKVSDGQFPIGTTRMRGLADLLAALYGSENFIFSLMENPEEMQSLIEDLKNFYIAMGKYQIDRIPDFHGGLGSFYYSMWAPKGTVWHQEDSCMLLSPDIYKENIYSAVKEIYNAFTHNICHFHSTGGYIPINEILTLNPTAIELHIDEGGPSAEALYDTHRKILAEVPLLIWGDMTEDDMDWIFSKLPPQGLAVQKVVSSQEEAHDLWSKYGSDRQNRN